MNFLSDMVDRHKGERFLVCGTGPSIDQYPADFYDNWPGVTVGVNDITDLFLPDYHIDIHAEPNVITDNINDEKIRFSYRNPSTGVDVEKTGLLSMVGTVAVTALTAAYQLGASEIHLIGVDLRTDGDKHHFDGCTSFWGKSHFVENIDELRATVRTFEKIFEAYRAEGVKVVNLSNCSLLVGSGG